VKVAGPSQPAIFSNVLSQLRTKEGDRVDAGQVIAVFDSYSSKQAAAERLQAQLAHAQRQYRRFDRLFHDGVTSAEERENWRTRVDVTKAELQQAQANLELARVRAPISGRVIKIHAYPGERVTTDDVADRIIHMEDGRLSSFTNAVLSDTKHLLELLTQNNRNGELIRCVEDMQPAQFTSLLEQVTVEFQQFLHAIDMVNHEAFESMLEQVIEAFTLKVGQIIAADRATLFLLDEASGELWSKVAQGDGGKPLEIRIPSQAGVAGRVATTGQALNIPHAYSEPLFNQAVDVQTGYRTHTILCVPIIDRRERVIGVVQLLNKTGGGPFTAEDEQRLSAFAAALGIVLESWCQMRASQLTRRERIADSAATVPTTSAAQDGIV
jgi:multidrug efflux pump subunit AcrA (membrane-fusion protein)